MKGYVIKSVGVATDRNPSFPKGTYSIKYLGKSGFVKDMVEYLVFTGDYWVVKRYAERKAQEYTKNTYDTFAKYPYWEETFEVVEVDLDTHK